MEKLVISMNDDFSFKKPIKLIHSCIYIYLVMFIAIFVWGVGILKEINIINIDFSIKDICLIIYGILIALSLTFIEDSFYSTILVAFSFYAYPFSLATFYSYGVYSLFAFIIIGIIIHLIRFKCKIKIGYFAISSLFVFIPLIISGLTNNYLDELEYKLILLAFYLFTIIVYVFLLSYLKEHSFYELSHIVIAFALAGIIEYIMDKNLSISFKMFALYDYPHELVFSSGECVSVLCIFAVSFALLLSTDKNIFVSLIALIFANIFLGFLFFQKELYGLVFSLISYVLSIIYAFCKSRNKKLYLIYFIIVSLLFVSMILLINFFNKDLLDGIIDGLRINNFKNKMNSKYDMIKNFDNYYVFGLGINNVSTKYGLNIFTDICISCGIFGLLAMLFHLFHKYYLFILNPNYKKVFVIIANFIVEIYTIFAPIKLSISYIIIMFVCFLLFENEVDKRDEKNLIIDLD